MLQTVATPGSLPETHTALSTLGGARIIAGGTSVMPTLNGGTDDFTSLVSLRGAGLSGIAIKDGSAVIGAATTLADLDDEPALGFLIPALETIASPTIRNMATVGGNLFVKQPYGDLAACLIALGATATVSDGTATRIEPVEKLVASAEPQARSSRRFPSPCPPPGTLQIYQGRPQGAERGGDRHRRGGRDGSGRQGLAMPHRARRRCRMRGARPLGRGGAGRQAARPRPCRCSGGRGRADIDPFDDSYASAWYRARVTPVHIRRALIGE